MHNKSSCQLSIIVTAHNLQDEIVKCLESIKQLVHGVADKCEVLMIDDASSDRTPHIMKAFSNDNAGFEYLRTEYGNIGKVRRYALSKARGDYITFVDGDDFVPLFSLKETFNFFDDKKPDILLSKLHEVWKVSDQVTSSLLRTPTALSRNEAIKRFLIHKQFKAHLWGKYFNSRLFKSFEFPEMACYEDSMAFPYLLADSENLYYTDTVLYNYVRREGSLSNELDSVKLNAMADVILAMNRVFGESFRNLTACHAIDLLHKYKDRLAEGKRHQLSQMVEGLSTLSFLLDFSVRTSFKRKFLAYKKDGTA
ncbi:glycosyltransferase [Hahella sp. KA22]|uniref:glycosyltransferase family 2 protein n=1 Tax=Hahella sp. KA22 TaxID=1628392 RepID=UPI000FDDEDDF|nr:glycosyltransferase family 2 protein [Hahella sp. KA22]AZZ95416.1 glycosyltransferase family 2 protein [Hahella sp. KA22]QAY53836.1 glycosyltransferase [Hahella sp. KA22]